MPDLIAEQIKNLNAIILLFNKLVYKNNFLLN